MNLAEICNVDMKLLDKSIKELLDKDKELPYYYKQQLENLIFSSGKRIRPIFTVLGSYFGMEVDKNSIYNLAAIFEIIHTASLIHDDMIDKADIRRGTPTLHKQFGTFKSLMLGNYLVALCSEQVCNYNYEEHYYKNFKLTELCDSEINQQSLLFNFNITFKEYITKTKNKTALLIAASLIGGAKLAMANNDITKILYNYAINLGISFQIIDDILDFTQNRDHLGKPNGADLINGNITLPVIFALNNDKISKKIRALNKDSALEDFQECINFIINSDAIEKSKQVSKKYINKSKKVISKLHHPKTTMLYSILEELEKRTY
ncbi:MAG TPA: polyprenyl synthetase family protein [Haloplasmataceae bacterium]